MRRDTSFTVQITLGGREKLPLHREHRGNMHFSIARLLLAVTAFAIAFGAFSYLGVAGVIVSTVIGMSVGAICLIVKMNQLWPMLRTGIMTILGGFVGLMFCPTIHPPYNPGDEFGYALAGGLIGVLLGMSMTASQQPEFDDPKNQN